MHTTSYPTSECRQRCTGAQKLDHTCPPQAERRCRAVPTALPPSRRLPATPQTEGGGILAIALSSSLVAHEVSWHANKQII